jgi:hypothetical protein
MLTFLSYPANAHFISKLWYQKGIQTAEYGQKTSPNRILIAGTATDFRNMVIAQLKDSLVADSMYVKTTSFKELKNQDASQWKSIVIFNTCIG